MYALVFNKYLPNQQRNESFSPRMEERPSLATHSYFSLVIPSSQHGKLLACIFTHRESSFTAKPTSPILSSMTSSTIPHSSQNLFISLCDLVELYLYLFTCCFELASVVDILVFIFGLYTPWDKRIKLAYCFTKYVLNKYSLKWNATR